MNQSITLKKNSFKLILGFGLAVAVFSLGLKVNDTKAQTNVSTLMPTSGSCALLVTLPVPYLTTGNIGSTGFNILGQIAFTSATNAIFQGSIVNPTFTPSNSPYIGAESTIYLKDWSVAVTPLTATNGFIGGYKMVFSGVIGTGNQNQSFELTAVPANGGKTILVQSSGVGTANNPGLGPGSGVCQI